jgi:hypothetical protein
MKTVFTVLGLVVVAFAARLIAQACCGDPAAAAPAATPDETPILSATAREFLANEPIISFPVDEFLEQNMQAALQARRERFAALSIKLRQEAMQYKGIKVRSEPGVRNVAAIEGAFVQQDPIPAERLEYFKPYLTKPDMIIHVGWHGVFLKETQDDQGSLVEVKIVPIFVGARGPFGMIKDHCIETWRYSPDGTLTFVKLVPGAKDKVARGAISYW